MAEHEGGKLAVPVRGGDKLKAHLREQKRRVRQLDKTLIKIGYFDPFIARIIEALEYGIPGEIPQRPAFRRAALEIRRYLHKELVRVGGVLTQAEVERIAVEICGIIRKHYLSYTGSPGLSASRRKAKRGTQGAGRQLVGPDGPKLVEHLLIEITKG